MPPKLVEKQLTAIYDLLSIEKALIELNETRGL